MNKLDPRTNPSNLNKASSIFRLIDLWQNDEHKWAVIHAECLDLKTDDPFVKHIIDIVRHSYGEHDIVKFTESLQADPIVENTFNLDAIRNAIRDGFPDPSLEGNKTPHLANYRSETCEMIARAALSFFFDIDFPIAPQLGKTNPNMPILGFDGWGLLQISDNNWGLVLIQVKGTDDQNRPPKEAGVLIKECNKISKQKNIISRALAIVVRMLQHNPKFAKIILSMLERLGEGKEILLVTAPTIVRGKVPAHKDDLSSISHSLSSPTSFLSRGLSISIGVDLADFGKTVMEGARGSYD